MLKVVIVDDEPDNRYYNRKLLNNNFPEIEIAGEAGSVDDAVKVIGETNPDLVLLDIEINGGTGFNVLQRLKPYYFKVIFITAFNDMALKAIKYSAMDYIVKPVNELEFCNAIEKVINNTEPRETVIKQNEFLLDYFKKENQLGKIVLKTAEAIHFVDVQDIIYCKSDNSYTSFFLTTNESIIVSKSIKEFTEMLEPYGFFRPHQSYLVNIKHIKKIDKADGGFLVLKNNKEIPLSVRQKKKILDILSKM